MKYGRLFFLKTEYRYKVRELWVRKFHQKLVIIESFYIFNLDK